MQYILIPDGQSYFIGSKEELLEASGNYAKGFRVFAVREVQVRQPFAAQILFPKARNRGTQNGVRGRPKKNPNDALVTTDEERQA